MRAAWLGAAAVVAQQVMAKTLRDSLFLAHHPASRLPLAFVLSAILSVAFAVGLARAIERRGPRSVMTMAWSAYAVLLAALLSFAGRSPAAAFALYLLVSAGGVALASGFWLQVGEAFDPRTARRGIAAIGSAGALGGVLAGAAAWLARGSYSTPVLGAMLIALLAAGAAATLRLARPIAPRPHEAAANGALGLIFRSDLLSGLAVVLAAVSAAAALLDWRFKSAIADGFGPAGRVAAFAAFYGVTSALVFVAQVTLAGPMLARAGIGRTIAVLPAGLMAVAAGAAIAPGALALAIARGLEVVLRGSLFRSGYELLFSPLDPPTRRATKGLLDIGADRLGDVIGATLAAALLALGLANGSAALIVAGALGAVALIAALGIERSYRAALADGLRKGVVSGDFTRSLDGATFSAIALSEALPGFDSGEWRIAPAETARATVDARTPESVPQVRDATPADPEAGARRAQLLRSGDPMRIRYALAGPLGAEEVEAATALLARDDFASATVQALRAAAPNITPALARALLDPGAPDTVRRRLARVLVAGDPAPAAAALTGALEDERFEVRIAAGRALLALHRRHPALPLDQPRLIGSVLAEAARGRKVWAAARELDAAPEDSGEAPFEGVVRDRTARGLEHCFTLLALMLPDQPLRASWRALQGGDPMMRGTALEYLEGALPEVVREALWPNLETEHAARAPRRPHAQVMDELLRVSPSMEIHIGTLGRGPDDPAPRG